MLEIVRGKIQTPTKAVIYGPEGVGKSTLGAGLPAPLFIDVEGGTSRLDVARTPRPTSWLHLQEIIRQIAKDRMGFQTLVIDTADWTEKLAVKHVCETNGFKGLGGNNDYGRSYNELAGMWSDLLTMLEADFIESGMHVVFLAHSSTRKFELPEEEGAFDRYELSLERKVAPLLKGWADLMLFCNYKTVVSVETDKTGKVTKARAQGGTRRVMCCEHTAAFDAKNRDGLPPEMDMDVAKILPCFSFAPQQQTPPTPAEPKQQPQQQQPAPTPGSWPTEAHRKLHVLMQEAGLAWDDVLAVMISRGKAAQGTKFEDVNETLIEQWAFKYWLTVVETAEKMKKEAA